MLDKTNTKYLKMTLIKALQSMGSSFSLKDTNKSTVSSNSLMNGQQGSNVVAGDVWVDYYYPGYYHGCYPYTYPCYPYYHC
ncbi:hypothetical protein DLAC_01298 [Tieghemostelium lacteum]|uniref:Uncharacterized protein n=1 Tax=Tieghemostelium lacteum TaxID=361077 RepID=A0A152A8S7_TIELA|nr:hypothetical protein DLAC_01298 [Tieghemostelium lacteum]|eukprot:KYR02457.1 hypothetical protein DLAC_01298 [Tieghemostelium lacteum]